MENAEHKAPRTASWFSIVGSLRSPWLCLVWSVYIRARGCCGSWHLHGKDSQALLTNCNFHLWHSCPESQDHAPQCTLQSLAGAGEGWKQVGRYTALGIHNRHSTSMPLCLLQWHSRCFFFITAAHTPQWNNTAKQLYPQLQRTIRWNPGEEHCRTGTGLRPPFWPVWTPLKAEQQATYTPEVIRSTYHHPGRMLTSQSRHTHTHREPGSSQISK